MDDDLYTLQKFKEHDEKHKKKETSAIDEQIQKRAAQIEEENYSMAKMARKKLEKSRHTQKATTSELLAQGEKLKHVKGDALTVNRNVRKGAKLTKQIRREGKLIPLHFSWWDKFVALFSKERRREIALAREMQENQELEEADYLEGSEEESEDISNLKGEEKTNAELKKIYKGLKGIKKEAKYQNREMKKQKSDIEKISRLNEHSEHVMSKTSAELKKI
ncbi:hypothetical protein TCON_2534 [Astathelohania contejeani]|uniref:Uncharacterized protein n=1 Tax=Astathelohania contejeani TaxID=164912 RepID=A0ABQ7HVQ6_9MICR|nr:hypothetical protein TCON_2534 [Thelohania contejeani]